MSETISKWKEVTMGQVSGSTKGPTIEITTHRLNGQKFFALGTISKVLHQRSRQNVIFGRITKGSKCD